RATLVHGVGARADQERALECRDGAMHRLRGGERAVVVARLRTRAAVLHDHRRRVPPVIRMYGNDLSSRSSTLKRGRSRLIRFASSSSASVSVAVVTNSINAVAAIMRMMRAV